MTRRRVPRESVGPFQALWPTSHDEHPVDLTIEQRLPQRRLRTKLRRAQVRILEALGAGRALWLEFDELNDLRYALREEAYFNLGYEQGLAAGRANALRVRGGLQAPGARLTADLARIVAVQSDVPAAVRVSALLEVAWGLAREIPTNR